MSKSNTAVSVVRPEATVTVTIKGKAHTLTEQEAKDLHGKLTNALGIQPETVIRREPAPLPFLSWTREPLRYLAPSRMPSDHEITCAINQR